ncbi:hypothetical protein [Colwellia sp. E150_009]
MKKLSMLLFAIPLLMSVDLYAACSINSLPQATSGYGSNGSFTQNVVSFRNPLKRTRKTHVFYPSTGVPSPTVFFSHAYGANDPDVYGGTIEHLNSIGYTVVFSEYPTFFATVSERYNILWRGFEEAASRYPQYIDTDKVAFFGHSFGGGATPRMALNGISQGWGDNGIGMYLMAPWYAYDLTNSDLSSFPEETNAIILVTEDDDTNDHEMAIDIFHNLALDDENKAYYILSEDTENGCTLEADHSMPMETNNGELDGLDFWNWAHMDALLDYTFTGNLTAKNIALGNGSVEQVFWGQWSSGRDYLPIATPINPLPSNPQSFYMFPCNDSDNPRAFACGTRN